MSQNLETGKLEDRQTSSGVQKIFIGGKWIPSSSTTTREIKNPANFKEVLGRVSDCNSEDISLAVKSAKNAQRSWWKMPGAEKAHFLHEAAKRIRANGRALAELKSRETGKPLVESGDCIEWIAACFEYYAEIGRSEHGRSLPPVAPHQVNFVVKEPYGVVAAIVPFNFPLLLMVWKLAPALAAGNTVVAKPPHQNPLSNLLMAECFSHFPPGVLNFVTGPAATGEILVNHPDVDFVAFTGSTEAGRRIATSALSQLKKVNLELGGIDPLIVFADADLDVAVKGAAWARLLNAGQVCTSAKRIYVINEIYDDFVRRLCQFVETVKVGDPMSIETDMGPLISEEAVKKVENQVARIVAEGGKLLYGGKRIQGVGLNGHYYSPTVFSEVKHGGIATTEEIFGPVISVIRAKNSEQAIEWANDSKFGLGATIYTKSLELSMRAMENIKAGTFWINDPLTDNDAGPFGGMRWSGVGRELGIEGLDAYREPKHVHLDYIPEVKNYWFPYRNRTLPF